MLKLRKCTIQKTKMCVYDVCKKVLSVFTFTQCPNFCTMPCYAVITAPKRRKNSEGITSINLSPGFRYYHHIVHCTVRISNLMFHQGLLCHRVWFAINL